MTPSGSGATRTVLALQRALAVAALLASGFAVAHCGSSNSGGNGSAANDAGGCASGDTRCEPVDAGQHAGEGGGDADVPINPSGPFCVSYKIMEEFYASLTPQCSCQNAWKHLEDAEDYVALLNYYPGIYEGAHVVGACPNLACCVRATSDDGGLVPEGCLCSGATLDCTNDVANGAMTATSCP